MELLDKCLALLKEKGADEGEVSLTHFQNEEMELKAGKSASCVPGMSTI